jgi:hypothetical protein
MAVFESLPGGPTPQQIQELLVNNPRESSVGFVVLILPTPTHQGMIYAIHSSSKFATHLGQPATQWDDHIFGSTIGKVVTNQNPITVKLPASRMVETCFELVMPSAWQPCLVLTQISNHSGTLPTLPLVPHFYSHET